MSTETPEMHPEDVPAEWVALAKEADLAHIHRRLKTAGPGAGGARPTSDHQTARLIAAVLPAHEAMVRAKVAEEIETRFGPLDPETDADETAIAVVRWLRGQCTICGRPYETGESCGHVHDAMAAAHARRERP